MPKYTPTYRLGYLARGGVYSGEIDRRRFITLDYNLDSYVGIVGIGIISGWEIERTDDPLTVKITPGAGMINGFYSESAYKLMQRSSMVIGDREVEAIDDDEIPEAPLSTSQRATYISVIQDYDPSFYNPDPGTPILNLYVKVVNLTDINCYNPDANTNIIVLNDNSDTYIVAERKFPDPYSCWSSTSFEYAPIIGDKPSSSSYSTYSSYKAALDTYNISLVNMRAYKWREYLQNHFTSVEFYKTATYIKSSSKTLIGKVVTRNGAIKKIDLKQVDNIANLNASIKEKSQPYIAGHIHGGDGAFDPPKINLKTDIRRCALFSYQSTGQVCTFDILENSETSVSVGHNHSYKIDADGNGNTVEVFGTNEIHFHKIISFVVGSEEYTTATIQTHDHTIPQTRETIDLDSNYVVYINDVPATGNISVDLVKRQVIVYGLIGEVYKTYSSSFIVSVRNQSTGILENETYSFEKSSPSVLRFMVEMIADFNKKYTFEQTIDETENGVDSSRHPFMFQSTDGGWEGFSDLQSQSTISQTLLKSSGNEYTFTPNAAKNVTILLKNSNSSSSDYEVKIELLGNTEITGILKDENIAFISAEKFTLGKFDIARIPPINHMGRMGEEFIPFQYPLVSTDGIEYSVSPAITTTTLDHYHKTFLDESFNGVTEHTYVAEDPVYYTYSNGVSYLIAHTHGVNNGEVILATGRDLSTWQDSLNGSNVASANTFSNTTSEHIHYLIQPSKGDPKVIYSIAETSNGDLLAGTSSGVYIIPLDPAYLFVINNIPIYQIGSDLWELFLKAKAEYTLQTGRVLVVTEDLYLTKINEAYISLIADGDSVLMLGYVDPYLGQDKIMIQRVEEFLLPNFKYTGTKLLNQIESDETVLDVKLLFSDGKAVTEQDIAAAIAEEGGLTSLEASTVELATFEKNLQAIPIWSILTDSSGNVFVCGAKEYSKISNLESNLYSNWSYATKPISASSFRKIYKDSRDNIWIPTENGLLVARYYQNGNIIEPSVNSGFSIDVNDVVEGDVGKIYQANNSGISLSIDYGKTWTEVLSINGGFTRIMKDLSGYLYAISKYLVIYKSQDGITWNSTGSIFTQEISDIVIFNGYFYACAVDGIYRNKTESGGTWEKVLDEETYSLSVIYDNTAILVGCNQTAYVSNDGVIYTKIANITGSAVPYLYTQNYKKPFGYAYNSQKQQFYFKELTYTEDSLSALVDFNIWMATEGSWNDTAQFDIYIDRKLIYSTKKDIDNRTETNYLFNLYPSQGTIDFGAKTTLTESCNVFDEYISVANSDGFLDGDRIYVICTESLPTKPIRPDGLEGVLQYFSNLVSYYTSKEILENMYFYSEVSGVSSGRLFLSKNVDKVINLPATVYKIPSLSGSTSIYSNIYDSMLTNVGTNTHEELDDITSYASDNRPYQLNNAYLSNLLQLTQAVKYVFPDIDNNMVNTKFFDFRYSWDPNDPNRPYIGDIIDLVNSEAYNDGLFDSKFTSIKSSMVNKILIGHGIFDDTIIIGTDIGVFYAKLTDSLESNWFYSYNLRTVVYDLVITNDNLLIAATGNGIYETTDLVNWVQSTQPPIMFPIYSLSYRWTGRETVKLENISATFSNVNGQGVIVSTGLGAIQSNRIIRITASALSEKSGNYSVVSASDTEIIVGEEFNGSSGSYTVTIEMGGWWEYLSGDVSTNNDKIKNTLLAGGRSMIAFASNVSSTVSEDQIIWRQGEMPNDLSQFSTADIRPLTNGSVLSSITSVTNNEENNLLLCNGSGSKWNRFKDFKAVKGTILNKEITTMGHMMLRVSYTFPSSYMCEDNSLNSKEIGFFSNDVLMLKTHVCSNEIKNGYNYITIYGQELANISDVSLDFIVYPLKINKILEIENKNVFYGTNQGLYFDDGSAVNFTEKRGQISKVGNGGLVTKIDIEGTISSISTSSSGKILLNVKTNDLITPNQLFNSELYIVDLITTLHYTVLYNSSRGSTGEITVELNESFNTIWNTYIGKRVVIVGTKSKVYITFDSPMNNDQFANGKLYVSSDENSNMGKSYDIESNTTSYIILKDKIIPRSTIVMDNDSLITGQTVKMVDLSNRVKLYVIFDDDTEVNQFVGFNFVIEEAFGSSNTIINQTMTIHSNTPYEIVLDPISYNGDYHPILVFSESNLFSIYGNNFVSSEGFNNHLTTISSDHYHNVSLIGQKLKGEINAIFAGGTAYMDITINSPDGFDNPVLLSDGDTIKDCKVIFYNPNNMAYSYETMAISYSGGILRVRIYNANIWNVALYEESKISPTWKFKIESQYSGTSNGIYYKDFSAITRTLISDLTDGEEYVYVDSTVDINVSDTIELFDTTGKTFVTYVVDVIDSEKLQINPSSDNTYLTINGSGIKVLRDDFSNNHTHRIRKTQIETLVIQDYLNLGYPSAHSHRLSPYVIDVSDLAVSGNKFLAMGSGEVIYVSYDNGYNWEAMIDLNNSLEWNEEVTGVSSVAIFDNKIIVGTTTGQIFSNTNKGWENIPLERPL